VDGALLTNPAAAGGARACGAGSPPTAAPFYEYRHVVGFEETNCVGNVYFVNHLRWQGRCREMFLHDHAPDVLGEIGRGLALVTTRVSCEYFAELRPFDVLLIRMRLLATVQNRVTMGFEYWRVSADGQERVAAGEQQVASMRREGGRMVPARLPDQLREALLRYCRADSRGGPGAGHDPG
jgi:enediyne biosynthesis thioesterase